MTAGKSHRRAHGEGSIYRRARDGRWVGMLDLGWIDGKRRRPTVTGATKAEVVVKLRQLRSAQDKGVDIAAAPRTLAAWLDEWMSSIKALDGTRPSTIDRYRIAIDTTSSRGSGGSGWTSSLLAMCSRSCPPVPTWSRATPRSPRGRRASPSPNAESSLWTRPSPSLGPLPAIAWRAFSWSR